MLRKLYLGLNLVTALLAIVLIVKAAVLFNEEGIIALEMIYTPIALVTLAIVVERVYADE